MPRARPGTVYLSKGSWYARLTLTPTKRISIPLPTCKTRSAAEARKTVLATIAKRLQAHDRLQALLLLAGKAEEGRGLDTVLRAVAATERGEGRVAEAPRMTFEQLATRWTSGELARLHRDRIPRKAYAKKDAGLFRKHVFPIVGAVPIADFTIDHADAVMRALPETHAASSRHQIAMLVTRVLNIAAMPLRLIPLSPIPKGWIPKRGPAKALGYLYPDEDRRLLGCERIPICFRIYYGFMAREGMRAAETERLTWADVDLERGAITLDVNKTDDPRAWAMGPDVVRALAMWRRIQREEYGACESVFVDDGGEPMMRFHFRHRAETFRAHLLLAGIDRSALHQRTEERRPIRAHDLRATFITIALANGKTEAWVMDRTGHRSSTMINRYRRAARTVAELGLGELAPLVEAIPELSHERTAASPAATQRVTRRLTAAPPPDKKRLLLPPHSSPPDSSRGTAGGTLQDLQPALIRPIVDSSDPEHRVDRARSRSLVTLRGRLVTGREAHWCSPEPRSAPRPDKVQLLADIWAEADRDRDDLLVKGVRQQLRQLLGPSSSRAAA